MSATPEVILFIIGGLITALWGLLLWRLNSMDKARETSQDAAETFRKETRTSFTSIYTKIDDHIKEDRAKFDGITSQMHEQHVELLNAINKK